MRLAEVLKGLKFPREEEEDVPQDLIVPENELLPIFTADTTFDPAQSGFLN